MFAKYTNQLVKEYVDHLLVVQPDSHYLARYFFHIPQHTYFEMLSINNAAMLCYFFCIIPNTTPKIQRFRRMSVSRFVSHFPTTNAPQLLSRTSSIVVAWMNAYIFRVLLAFNLCGCMEPNYICENGIRNGVAGPASIVLPFGSDPPNAKCLYEHNRENLPNMER